MSEDFTQKLPKNGNDEILTAIKDLDTHVTQIDTRLQSVEKKVDSLEKKVDERLYDTRPIWHKVVAEIAELQSGQKRLEDGQKRLEETIHKDIGELSSAVRTINSDQIVTNDAVRRMQVDFFTVNEWLNKLIADRNQQNSST
ncbi:MAG TPA: hypothetical protein VGN10_19325 [Pyrinomonadaceae bacterium]|jgi:predicted  nucleic acid-binding Zn-ribbon protein